MAVTLYRNYTVTVQDSESYEPRNDLELFLYEGQVEIKTNPATSTEDVFSYGTTTLATRVVNSSGVNVTALIADATTRPGEYDFEEIDLNSSLTPASAAGETLYSVVGRPATDTDFSRGIIIVDRTDLADSNAKQLVIGSQGGTSDVSSNVAFAGGTVAYSQYTVGVTNDATTQHLKINNLPSEITNLITQVTDSPLTPATTNKLVARFNVYYSDGGSPSVYCLWRGVPAYQVTDESWVIRIRQDQYSVRRSGDFGSGGGTEIDLSGILTSDNFIVSVNLQESNVFLRRFDATTSYQSTPSTSYGMPITGAYEERTAISQFFSSADDEPAVGVGTWTYLDANNTPYYNLDVKGARGFRHTIGSTVKMLITPSSTIMYYDTNNFISFGSGSMQIESDSKSVMQTLLGDLYIGSSLFSYPFSYYSSSGITHYGSTQTYLQVNTGNAIYGNVKVSSSSYRSLRLASSQSDYGYNVESASGSIYRASVSSTAIISAGSLQWTGTSSILLIGQSVGSYPQLTMTDSYIRMESGSTTYHEVIDSSMTLRSYVDSKQAMNLVSTQSDFGYNIGTGYYARYSSSSGSIYGGSTLKLFVGDSTVFMGLAGASGPMFFGNATDIYLWGTNNTKLQVSASDEIDAYAGSSGYKAINLKQNDSYFGYKLTDSSNGIYWRVTNFLSYLIHQNKVKVYADATDTILGYDYISSPYVHVNASEASLYESSSTYFKTSSSGHSAVYSTTEKLAIISSHSRLLFDSDTYFQASSGELWMYAQGGTDSAYVKVTKDDVFLTESSGNRYVQLGGNRIILAHTTAIVIGSPDLGSMSGIGEDHIAGYARASGATSVPYWKIPYTETNPASTSTPGPKGAMMLYKATSTSKYYLLVNVDGAIDWNSVELT